MMRLFERLPVSLCKHSAIPSWKPTAAAIRQAERHHGEIHLLVSDVVTPEMGGRQLLDAVRQFRPGLRVLFMSGYTDDAVLLHGVVDATDAFIQKSFTRLSLARKVREVIDVPVK
jgi:two-component system cell cycle sensor histidine kinase/response regulator CckA